MNYGSQRRTRNAEAAIDAAIDRHIRAYQAAQHAIAELCVLRTAMRIRAAHPAARWIALDWSDQGDCLDYNSLYDSSGQLLEVNDDQVRNDLWGYVSNLDSRVRSTWEKYVLGEHAPFLLDIDKARTITLE
jgi:hypothetical protein